ncbi:MAG: ComEC/Rec2 family competence protein [Pseudomonadota bacterium]
MQKLTAFFYDIFTREKDNLWLWMPVLFGFGAAFYFLFEENFLEKFTLLAALFFISSFLAFLNRNSLRFLVFLGCALFLLGGFYSDFYQKTFLNHTKITGKIYVDGIGKVESVRKFYNPKNGVEGVNLVISEPVLYKSKFAEKKKVKKKYKKKKKTKKKTKKKKEKTKKPRKKKILNQVQDDGIFEEISPQRHPELVSGSSEKINETENPPQNDDVITEPKKKKPRKPRKKKILNQVQDDVVCLDAIPPHCHPELDSGSSESLKKIPKPKKKKPRKKKKISEKTILKNFVNLKNYQEIDREFLDHSKNYQFVEWQQIKERERFPNPPQKISINLIKNFENISVNDVIAIRMMLQPSKAREFPDDFDFSLDAKFKKIGAYGFAIGEAKILKKAEISNLEQWFLNLREKVRSKIENTLEGDISAIALAFLIGDQNQISKNLMSDIRNSGLAHLLSISGFHLALASAIFFVATRFILSRSAFLILNFDIKKAAALAAIFGTYFYLKIAASPMPAQRAFLMVLLVLIALFVGQKINSKRAIMTAVLALILYNPLAVFNISFQLSFAAILVLGSFYEVMQRQPRINYFLKVFWYFVEIILVSIIIQIATTPFLMHSFQTVSLLGFVSNILAIPLTSFFVMPLGFLALFLMPLNLEKYALILMGKGILLIEKIAVFVAKMDYSNLVSPQLSSFGLIIAILGLLLICLSSSRLLWFGILIFSLSFLTLIFDKKPDILFDGGQKFFAIYDQKNGLVFSKDLKPSKEREIWLKKMGEIEFKSNSEFIKCEESKCLISKNQKILVLLKRNKISEICKNDFDVIVNLTAKYALPSCITAEKIKIDNSDFYQKGGQFFYFEEGKIRIKTTS